MKPGTVALLLNQGRRKRGLLPQALLVSILAHASVFVLLQRPAAPTPPSQLEHQQLEVVLVNTHNSKDDRENPEARLLAQTTLQGGGDADSGHASTPLPKLNQAREGNALNEKRQQLASLQRQQDLLLQAIKDDIVALEKLAAEKQPQDQKALLEKRQMLLDQLGVIENRINAVNERPRKRYIHPSTREVVYARYYDLVKQRVEDVGTRHFPKENGKNLYGHLIVSFGLNADGQLLSARVVEHSAHPALDAHALKIIEMSMPMEKFDRQLRARADQLVIVARFDFKQDNQLQTTLSPQSE